MSCRIAVLSPVSSLFLRSPRRWLSCLYPLKHLSSSSSSCASHVAVKPKLQPYALSARGADDPSSTITPTGFSSPAVQTLSSLQKDQISTYVSTLLQWNQKMNLTAVTEEKEVMTRHVDDSLALLPPLRRAYSSHCCSSAPSNDLNVVDVGSGAGLPGLIFAIAYPSKTCLLVFSISE